MEDVAEASGITRLIVYRNFASKEDLYRAVLERVTFRLRDEFLAGRARGEATAAGLLAVAREDPDAFRLLWVHAAREPQFAAYAAGFRAHAGAAAERPMGAAVAAPVSRRWAARVVVAYLYDAVLAWLDEGDPARDAEFVAVTTRGLHGMIAAWASVE